MRNALKTTTALVAGLHLAMPQVGFAQDQISIDQLLEVCADLEAEACATATGLPVDQVAAALSMAREGDAADAEPAPEAAEATPEAAVPAPEAAEAAPETAEPEAEAAEAAPEAAEAAPEAADAAPESTEAAQEVAEPAPEAVEADAAPAEELTGTDAIEAAEETAELPEEAPEADAEALRAETEEPAAEPVEGEGVEAAEEATELTADPAETAETEPTEATPSEAATEEAPEMIETDEEPVLTEQSDDGETEAEAAKEAEAAPQSDEGAAQAEAEGEAAPADTATASSDDALPDADAAPETQMTDAERQALEGSGAAPVAAAASGAEPAEEIASESVTEETARSSDEDFQSDIAGETGETAAAAPAAQAEASDDDDDDGLSTLQKALIAGAGVIAVGTLLNNNRQVVASSQDRVVVSGRDGGYEIIKDDTALLRRPGTEVSTERFDDGSTRTTVLRQDGSQIVTIRDADLRVLQRVRVTPDGDRIVLIDDTIETQAVDVTSLRPAARSQADAGMDEDALRQALAAEGAFDRSFSLAQVRNISQVREQVPAIDLDNITFASGSAAIAPEQADELTDLGRYIRARVEENPQEIFLVEGHTDAVGNAAFNLALSDRRAESVALALTEYFDVPPENLVVQGYGERFLKVPTLEAERQNRRATLRRITPLLQTASAQ